MGKSGDVEVKSRQHDRFLPYHGMERRGSIVSDVETKERAAAHDKEEKGKFEMSA